MKKALAIILTLSMVMGSFCFAFAENGTEAVFPDVDGIACQEAVETLYNYGVINGYTDGTYQPEGIVTRAEMAKLIVTALGLAEETPEGTAAFSDTAGHWAESFIAYAAELGIIEGYPDGSFGPQRTVTYNEAVTMIVRALGYPELEGTWPDNFMAKGAELGVTEGVAGTTAGANRGDIAILLFQALDVPIAGVEGDTFRIRLEALIVEVSEAMRAAYEAFLASADPDFAYDIALELTVNPDYLNSDMGGRQAGSDAEHAASYYLADVMEEIGLTDVERVGAECDKWQFNGASFTIGDNSYDVYSYATEGTDADGVTAEVVYMGDGTMWDYYDENGEEIDVTGKIVLVDIDMRANWWITYPMLEAQARGAAGILSCNVGGFSQIADDALNCQDICAGTGIPCLSIGVADAQEIKDMLEEGPVTANMVVDNIVEINTGTTYNVTGKIEGKSSDHQIIVGAHYDTHFWGFQDDNCAVGLVLAMAKGMIDAGYVPENDIVFCLHGAEEWGSSYTQFDWTVGAWEMINNEHPDWVGKTLAFINFELPAYEFGTYTSTYSAPEMYKMLDYFVNKYPLSPDPEGCFPDGVKTAGYQTYTYSDDFSYYAAGVPSTVNGFLLQEDMETPFDFYIDIYHSQYDVPETYDEDVMNFNLTYYGALAMFIDQMPALYLDYTTQYQRILDSIDADVMAAAGVDTTALLANLEVLKEAAEANLAEVERINSEWLAAAVAGDAAAMAALRTEGKALTQQNLDAFEFAQEAFLGLMYERPIVPHEAPQENILLAGLCVEALEEGDVVTAADEYAWCINNVLEWYSMYFSPEVIDVQDDMFWGDANQDNLYWGTGRMFVKADVEDATRSLMLR
ncbi:MAG: S-layer homology domain-containing protein, partial [Bacillota bacterium]|nr:S-layer homology domain-containing protein [Bacillota bacterium]